MKRQQAGPMRPAHGATRWVHVGLFVCALFSGAGEVDAQPCKPDIARVDPITKERVQVWGQNLWESSFLSNLDGTSQSKVTASIGRYGAINALNLEIEKRERSAVNAIVEAQYRASRGKPISFGFDGGPPLTLLVTDVSNQSAKGKGLADNQYITRVVVSGAIDDARLGQLRDQLTSARIDALRMALDGDLNIDRKVDAKQGERMRAKFACFFAALDAGGVALPASAPVAAPPVVTSLPPVVAPEVRSGASAAGGAAPVTSVVGRYDRPGTTDSLELRVDGSMTLLQNGRTFSGTYTSSDSTVVLAVAGARATTSMRINRDSLTDPQNSVWLRRPQAPSNVAAPSGVVAAAAPPAGRAGRAPAMTVDQILQMVTVKIPDDVIASAAEHSEPRYRPSAEDLIALKKAGASDVLMRALVK